MPDETSPVPTQDLTAEADTTIARSDSLDLSNETPIDGTATIEVKYL
ncbi:hypothetical protein AB0M22_04885 [Nocardia sp. NPDC051756]